MSKTIICYGIDLGTTNSSLGIVDASIDDILPKAEIVEIAQPTPSGEKISAIVPSIVAYYDGIEWIGEGAREVRNLSYDPNRKVIRNRTLFYETKNEIGTSRKYKGQNNITSPVDVASKIIKFICDKGIDPNYINDIVVTVPASFQSKQRIDTMEACNLAGLKINGHRLLDEPCAAFIDYASRHKNLLVEGSEKKNLLVFDFGGGTCDIAIFELNKNQSEKSNSSYNFSSLSVSRYHRLGGGDIDLAIIHKILIPALIRENNLTEYELEFDEQQAIIVPALISVAEALKIQISNEIWRLKEFNQYEKKLHNITAKFPAITKIESPRLKKKLTLSPDSTNITIDQFEEILEPFLTTVQLVPNIKEERIECSIFTPIEDALDRANLKYNDIDHLFIVGGSALIPQIVESIQFNFPKSNLITYKNRKDF
jgi:molecular chaperone DnaK